MENSIDYINHVNIVKDLNLYNRVRENQKPFEDKFEVIYAQAKEADVKLSDAKEFLSELSRDELRTLQKFEGLADAIDVGSLSDEGAYNLLVHDYEKYDFNGDGAVMRGAAKTLAHIPEHMDDEAKKAWVKALNAMGDDLMGISVMTMSLNEEFNNRQIASHLSQMSDAQIDKMQESASFDIRAFINETLSKPYSPKTLSVLDVLDEVDAKINSTDGGYSSPELIKSLERLREALQNAIEEVEAKAQKLSTAEELEIKQEIKENKNEVKEEPLAVAIKSTKVETRTPEEIIAEYRAMPGQGGIAYEGMFEEQRAASLAKHEPYFQKEYEHYEKYKDVFTPIYSNYTTEKADKIGQELNAQFPEFGAMREKAYMGGTQQDKEAFEEMFWDYQAYNKYLREKHDLDMSTGGFMAASKESSKAYNFAVYEGLESGLSIGEATAKASSLLSTFGGNQAQSFSLMFFSGLPEDIEAATEIAEEEIDYDKQINLSDYGFEHNFWSDAYLDTYGNDSVGVKSRILYDIELYSFLLENEDIVDTKLAELKDRAYESENGKDWYDWRNEDGKFNENFKSSFQTKYDNAIYAKEILEKYGDKIFDNSVLDEMNTKDKS
ncbi:hypothetical protein [Sulfurimonas sp.]|uniref:hypothetical protein n=1 Tax=Sulfurimonas sp. TaxID=2022749 RepID=UPI0025D785DB|nr:hypothetical protein [Sulfurimonas sp.]MCK9472476.1 hypothetical protein [Sulfurimonas sp.]